MSKKPNIGIIGAGMIADFHLTAVEQTKLLNVVWVADPNPKARAQKQKRYAIPNAASDYHDILADDNVDAVIICAPPFVHLEAATAALRAGKHVLCEKPMALNRRQVNRLVKEVQKHKNLVFLECSCRHARLQPKFHFVKKLIDNGDIGRVYHIHHNSLIRRTFIEYNPNARWAMKKKTAGGGPFIDWGVYDLSFHLGLLNDKPKLKKITSFTRTGLKIFRNPKIKTDIEQHGAAFMQFDRGLTYYYERGGGVHCEIPNETRIFGTRGSLRFAFCSWDPPEIEHFWVDKNGKERRTVRKVDMSKHPGDHPAFIKHFADCLAGKAKPLMPVTLAAKHLDIIFRILAT